MLLDKSAAKIRADISWQTFSRLRSSTQLRGCAATDGDPSDPRTKSADPGMASTARRRPIYFWN